MRVSAPQSVSRQTKPTLPLWLQGLLPPPPPSLAAHSSSVCGATSTHIKSALEARGPSASSMRTGRGKLSSPRGPRGLQNRASVPGGQIVLSDQACDSNLAAIVETLVRPEHHLGISVLQAFVCYSWQILSWIFISKRARALYKKTAMNAANSWACSWEPSLKLLLVDEAPLRPNTCITRTRGLQLQGCVLTSDQSKF